MASLTVTPTSFPEDTDTLLTFVGSGWNPNAQLVIGVLGETSGQVANVDGDGTFTRTWQSGLRRAGGAKAFADATGGDNPEPLTESENVNLHVTNVH